jgi:DNA-binding CsgD family transcriptional regulator/tetratricopeptide (TPR) repeat protein
MARLGEGIPLPVGADDTVGMGPRITSPRFVGRPAELGRVDAALAAAGGGEPRTLLVAGEAGVGKTRLVAELARRAHASGGRVLLGGCLQVGEDALPYTPISEALRDLFRSVDPADLASLVGDRGPELSRLVPGLAPVAAAESSGGRRELPATLRELLLARVDALSEAAQEVLRIAATAGRRVDHRLLSAVCALDERVLLDAVREAVAGQVLVADPAGRGYAFRHALLQEVVYDDLLAGERSQLHGALARALAARPELGGGTPAEAAAELAVHWHASGDLVRALPAAVAAAAAAEDAVAFAEAQRHYERALDLFDQVPAAAAAVGLDRVRLLERTAAVAHLAGDHRRAVALARRALAAVDPADRVRAGLLQARLGRYLWVAGSEEVLGAYERAVELVPAEPPSAERAGVLAGYANILLLYDRVRAAHDYAEQALAMARAAGALREEGQALRTLGTTRSLLYRDFETALRDLTEACRIAEETGEVDDLGRARNFLPQVLDDAGRLEEALAETRTSLAVVGRIGLLHTNGRFLAGFAGDLLRRLGRWDEAEQFSRQATDHAGERDTPALLACAYRLRLLVGRGELDAVRALLDSLRHDRFAFRVSPLPSAVGEALAAIALDEGRPLDARAAVADALARLAGDEEELQHRTLLTLGLRIEADLAEQARARREPDGEATARRRGAVMLAGLRGLAEQAAARGAQPLPETAAHIATGEAEANRLEGRPDPPRWAAAAAAWAALRQPYPAAYAHWREAEALLSGRRERARAAVLLREAHATTTRLGAAPLWRAVERLALQARIDLAPSSPPAEAPAAEASPAERLGLTRREREVLALVAAGMTNRQIADTLFISVKTASIHVSAILAKLGVASRVEAAAAAWRGGLVDQPAGPPPTPPA